MRRRENTFRIDYANYPRKPSFEELHEFVNTDLGLQKEQVIRIQPSRSLHCAFVKVADLSIAQKIVEEHDNMHETEIDGKIYKLRISLEDGAVAVKIFDLSEDVSDEKIIEYLRAYGEVLSIRELMWDDKFTFGGIPSGVREVKMMVKGNIPSYVTIDGEITALSYYGQQQTCRHCSEFVHNGISCVQNKKLLVQKFNTDQSYAKVVKQQNNQKPQQTLSVKQNTVNQKDKQLTTEKNTTITQTPTTTNLPSKSTQQNPLPSASKNKTAIFKMPLRSSKPLDEPLAKTTISDLEIEGEESERSTASNPRRSSFQFDSRSSRRRPPAKKKLGSTKVTIRTAKRSSNGTDKL